MRKSYEAAESAREREQRRQASYYNRKVKNRRAFKPGDRTSRRNWSMKIRASHVKMSRQQDRLLDQRRCLFKQQREEEWTNARQGRWTVTRRCESRVAQWWRSEEDDVKTRPGVMFSNTSCDQCGEGSVPQEPLRARGSPEQCSTNCTRPTESWKTLWWKKACNGSSSRVDHMAASTGPDTCVAEDALWRRKRERGPADEGRPSHRNGRASEQGGAEADQLASKLQPAEHVPTVRAAPTIGGRNKGLRGT
ncbi:uncharacterized protein PITG_20362 [Phytophthora infestans T30-4]|uniref:Uncharacterized protein n=1 Tax=Phytophthora infestans (strain T30-4) TaxID=403677 RepID=D0P1R1_PHYIT|nr:uncharacterized protein PITG_20362 [Phytophthora infestans T30-4]EEY54696.1 conserved hypothetical protein [Phytophthora infestans T30-4]|eukprot:XP_002895765.1 conserved hypothetical protein [Phytophthora infestans T30-4]